MDGHSVYDDVNASGKSNIYNAFEYMPDFGDPFTNLFMLPRLPKGFVELPV